MSLKGIRMDKPKVVASIAVTAALLTVSGVTMMTRHATAAADKENLQKQRRAAGMPDMEGMRARMLEQTAIDLGLSTNQKEQFQAAQESMGPGMGKIFADKSLSREQIGERMRQAREEQEARIRAILTPAQQAKYDQMQTKRREEWQNRRAQDPKGSGFGGSPRPGMPFGGRMGGPPSGAMMGGPPPGGLGGPPPGGFAPPPNGPGGENPSGR